MDVSFFESLYARTEASTIPINLVFDKYIKSDFLKSQTERIRLQEEKEKRDKLKQQLPVITTSGVFSPSHKKENYKAHSGLIQLDIDYPDNIHECFKRLSQDEYILYLWYSPSGQGIKGIVKIPPDPNKHVQMFVNLAQYFKRKYNVCLDEQCKNINRLMFLSYSSVVVFNADSKVFDISFDTHEIQHKIGTTSKDILNNNTPAECDKVEIIAKAVENRKSFINGQRNAYVYDFATSCNKYGVCESECMQFASKFIRDDFSFDEIARTVKSGYSNVAEYNTLSFSKESQKSVVKSSDKKINNISTKEHADKWGFLIENGAYYKIEYRNNKPVKELLSNFVMMIKYHLEDGTKDTGRLIELHRNTGEVSLIEVRASEMSAEKFEIVLKSNRSTFFGSTRDLKRIFCKLMNDETSCIKLGILGYNPEHKVYVFANGIMVWDNDHKVDFIPVNELGIVKYNNTNYYLPSYSSTNLHNEEYENDRQFAYKEGNLDFSSFAALFYQAYGINGAIGICHIINALFWDIVFKHTEFFPFLFLFGTPGGVRQVSSNCF